MGAAVWDHGAVEFVGRLTEAELELASIFVWLF